MPCPVCDSEGGVTLFEIPGAEGEDDSRYTLRRCPGCGVAYADPPPATPEILAGAPEESPEPAPASPSPLVERLLTRIGRARARRLAAGMVAGSALDLGSSAGRMLAGLRDLGWKVTAVVTTEEAARKARQRGIPVRVGPLESHHLPDDGFDLVTFFQVVEPIPLRAQTLRELHRILRPGGRLVVAVPTFGFLQEKLFGHRWMNLNPQNPPVYFNERSLERLLELSGFAPEEVKRFSPEYSPLTWLQSLENLALRRNNLLYKMLRGRHGGLAPVTLPEAAAVAGAFVLAPAATAAAAIAAAARQGDCLELTARKR